MTREQKLIEKLTYTEFTLGRPRVEAPNNEQLMFKINELVEEVVEQRKEIQLLKDNIKNL